MKNDDDVEEPFNLKGIQVINILTKEWLYKKRCDTFITQWCTALVGYTDCMAWLIYFWSSLEVNAWLL